MINLEKNDDNSNDENNEMPNLAIDITQKLFENANNMSNGGDGEVPLTV